MTVGVDDLFEVLVDRCQAYRHIVLATPGGKASERVIAFQIRQRNNGDTSRFASGINDGHCCRKSAGIGGR